MYHAKKFTLKEIAEIELKYGEGFLKLNPNYPNQAVYYYPDGATSSLLVPSKDREKVFGIPQPKAKTN